MRHRRWPRRSGSGRSRRREGILVVVLGDPAGSVSLGREVPNRGTGPDGGKRLKLVLVVHANRRLDRSRTCDQSANLRHTRRELNVLEYLQIVWLHRKDRQHALALVVLDWKDTKTCRELMRDDLQQVLIDRSSRQLLRRNELRLVVVGLELQQTGFVEHAYLQQRLLDVHPAPPRIERSRFRIARRNQLIDLERMEKTTVHARHRPIDGI